MAGPYYVRTPGNGGSDSNNGLSFGAPFATINHAYGLCTGGETIYVDDGTYAEGTTFWSVSRAMGSTVTIQGYNGLSSNVTITGVSGASEVIFTTATNTKFQDVKFAARSNASTFVLRFNPATLANIYFLRCTITVTTNSGQTNTAVKSQFVGSSHNTTNITFDACTINCSGSDPADGINFTKNSNSDTLDNVQIINGTVVNVTRHAVALLGVTNALVKGNSLTSSTNNVNGSSAGTTMQLGVDGTSGFSASGSILGNIITSTYSHGCLIGAGVTSATVSGNWIYGGAGASAGQGMVIKQCSGVTVTGNVISAGDINGLYFKAATSCTATYNTVINFSNSLSYCLHMGWDSSNSAKSSGNTVQYNRFITNISPLIYWGSSTEITSDNVCDYNVYEVSGTGVFGSWQNSGASNNITNFADLQSKQAAYLAGNDTHSVVTGSAPMTFYLHTATGAKLYRLMCDTKGNIWDGSAFVVFNLSDFYKYARFMVEAIPSSYRYSSVLYSTIPAGDYYISHHVQAGNMSAITDTVLQQSVGLAWDGTDVVGSSKVNRKVDNNRALILVK